MPDFLQFINDVIWGSMMIYLLAGAGIWFTFRTGFIQFRYLRHYSKSLKNSLTPQPGGLTSFQALCTSLAARAGSGNLAGISLAIATGGPGAIFWMWISGLTGMAISFAECSLSQLYKQRDAAGQFRGGPAWYMAHGLGMRWMGILFSLFLLLSYGLVFNTIQAHSVASALNYAFTMPSLVTGIILAVLILLIITGGLRRVVRMMQWLVPVMVIFWVATSLWISAWHIAALPETIYTIVKSAFGWHEAAAGAAGYTVSQALTSGFQRGMFSNEAGIGSTPNVAAAASSWPPHPAAQGIVQMIGVFIDTFILSTCSALIVLLAGPNTLHTAADGIQRIQQAMVMLIGDAGPGFVAIVVALLAFTSIVGNYLYAENNLVFLRLDTLWARRGLRAATFIMIVAGSLLSFPLVWQLANIAMALMALTNLTAILLLSPVVRLIANDYLRQRKLGVRPVFDPQRYPDLHQQLTSGAWDNLPKQ